MKFRRYYSSDFSACVSLFSLNYPKYFAESEKYDYQNFLREDSEGYTVGLIWDVVVAAYGVSFSDNRRKARLHWIMVSSSVRGCGSGTLMMERAIDEARKGGAGVLEIATSQLSASFFEKFGAKEIKRTENGWAEGMDRVDMEIQL